MTTIEKINKLTEQMAALDLIRLRYAELRDTVLTPEIKAKLDEINAEEAIYITNVQARITPLEAEIKAEVIAAGKSVKGDYLHAIYSKPRVTWDTKGLDGFAVAHPEMEKFRKVGEPQVSFRQIG